MTCDRFFSQYPGYETSTVRRTRASVALAVAIALPCSGQASHTDGGTTALTTRLAH